MYITLTKIAERCDQGVTRPFICACDDGQQYIVKGNYAGNRALVCEWISAQIAMELELPIPDFKIIDVPRDIIDYGVRDDLVDLGYGPVFGSKFVENTIEVPYSSIEKIPIELRAWILLFDKWIQNGDRTLGMLSGNPNLLYSTINSKIWVIDHNLAFAEDVDDTFFSGHIFLRSASQWSESFRKQAKIKMDKILNRIDDIWQELPDKWTEVQDTINLDLVKTVLSRFKTDPMKFWGQV